MFFTTSPTPVTATASSSSSRGSSTSHRNSNPSTFHLVPSFARHADNVDVAPVALTDAPSPSQSSTASSSVSEFVDTHHHDDINTNHSINRTRPATALLHRLVAALSFDVEERDFFRSELPSTTTSATAMTAIAASTLVEENQRGDGQSIHAFEETGTGNTKEDKSTTTPPSGPQRRHCSLFPDPIISSSSLLLATTEFGVDDVVYYVHRLLHGTLDPDGIVDEVYYDAVEYGDGIHRDVFEMNYHRESIVLPSCPIPTTTSLPSQSPEVQKPVNDLSKGVENDTRSTALHARGGGGGVADPPMSRDAILSTRLPPPPNKIMISGPPPPTDLPLRFLRAGKGDPVEGWRRYEATLKWRQEHEINSILREPSPHFASIKQHYLHYCHFTGHNNEPCYYEMPPRTNLQALRQQGVTLDKLLRHYTMIQEYHWQMLNRDDLARSIYIIDLKGIRLGDFVGEVIDFVKRASQFTSQHYPERAGCVFVIHVPAWFKLIWSVVRPWIDEVTLKKIYILRGDEEIRRSLMERIPLDHIPPEYGGTSVPLGHSPQEEHLLALMEHNNALANGQPICHQFSGPNQPCFFCFWQPARSY